MTATAARMRTRLRAEPAGLLTVVGASAAATRHKRGVRMIREHIGGAVAVGSDCYGWTALQLAEDFPRRSRHPV
jgi:hypothetical protein